LPSSATLGAEVRLAPATPTGLRPSFLGTEPFQGSRHGREFPKVAVFGYLGSGGAARPGNPNGVASIVHAGTKPFGVRTATQPRCDYLPTLEVVRIT
jgi:hypothetical protein